MANYKISQLPSSSALTSDDFLPIVDSGTLTTQRATAQQILDYVTGSTFNTLNVTNLTSSKSISEEYLATKKITISNSAGTVFQMSAVSDQLLFDVNPTARNVQFFKNSVETASFGSGADWTVIGNTLGTSKITIGEDIVIDSSGLSASNITASNIQAYEQRVDYILNTNFLRVSGTSLVTDVYQDTSTRFVVDTNAQHFQFFKLATPVTAGFGNASTSLTKVDGINVEIGNASSTVKVAGTLTGSTARFTTISSSNASISGNFVLSGPANLTEYPDYAYIIYTSSYDKLVAFPGLYVSGNLTGSGNAKFNEVSGTIAQFTDITSSNINISGNIEFLQRAVIRNVASSSGDYFGASTLELIPDINLSGNGQYLVIDPTSPSHIHIRAGGVIDSAQAQLIIGGEKANIIVRDQDNSYTEKHWVQITTTENVSSASFVWDFGNDGKLTLPGQITGTIAEFTELTGNVSFTAADPALWSSPPPITIQDAINRIAAAVYSGNTGLIA